MTAESMTATTLAMEVGNENATTKGQVLLHITRQPSLLDNKGIQH